MVEFNVLCMGVECMFSEVAMLVGTSLDIVLVCYSIGLLISCERIALAIRLMLLLGHVSFQERTYEYHSQENSHSSCFLERKHIVSWSVVIVCDHLSLYVSARSYCSVFILQGRKSDSSSSSSFGSNFTFQSWFCLASH